MKLKVSINKRIINRNENLVSLSSVESYQEFTVVDFKKHIKNGFAWNGPELKDNKVKLENFIQQSTLGIDIDHGLTTQEVMKDTFVQKNAILLYTSASHTDEANRFRLVFVLEEPIVDPEKGKIILKKLIAYFKSDKQCSNCNRFFYGNTKARFKFFGENYLNIDELDSLAPASSNAENDSKEYLCFEKQLANKDDLKKMLEAIKSKNTELGYSPWLHMCSAIWSVFSYDESIELLQENFPEEKFDEYKYKYNHRLDTIPYSFLIKMAVKSGFKVPESSNPNHFTDFIYYTDKGKVQISQTKLQEFLYESGYFSYFFNENDVEFNFIFEKYNLIRETSIKKMSEFVKNFVIENRSKNDSEDVQNLLIEKNIISAPRLNFLTSKKIKFHRDTKDQAFFYYKNGFLEITKDDFVFHADYNKIKPRKLWKNNLLLRKFEFDRRESEFSIFLQKVANEDDTRYKNLQSIIGYLLHKYKNPNINKCVVLNDEKMDVQNPNGRTGKSLIGKALGHIRQISKIDGRSYKYADTFKFQNIELNTEIVNMDDIPKNFDLKKFYSILSGDLKIEKKREQAIILPFERSPKWLFSTNYAINTGGGSDRARVCEATLHNHYTEHYQPIHEFGHLFFTDWGEHDWWKFDYFMGLCIQKFLQIGLDSSVSKKLLYNKVLNQTSEKFVLWLKTLDIPTSKEKIYIKTELKKSFEAFCLSDDDKDSIVSNNQLTRFMKIFFNIFEIPYAEKRKRFNNDILHWVFEIRR